MLGNILEEGPSSEKGRLTELNAHQANQNKDRIEAINVLPSIVEGDLIVQAVLDLQPKVKDPLIPEPKNHELN